MGEVGGGKGGEQRGVVSKEGGILKGGMASGVVK